MNLDLPMTRREALALAGAALLTSACSSKGSSFSHPNPEQLATVLLGYFDEPGDVAAFGEQYLREQGELNEILGSLCAKPGLEPSALEALTPDELKQRLGQADHRGLRAQESADCGGLGSRGDGGLPVGSGGA